MPISHFILISCVSMDKSLIRRVRDQPPLSKSDLAVWHYSLRRLPDRDRMRATDQPLPAERGFNVLPLYPWRPPPPPDANQPDLPRGWGCRWWIQTRKQWRGTGPPI